MVNNDTLAKAYTGNDLMAALEGKLGRQEAAKLLADSGVPGLRYLDQGSRGAGDGTHNYVVFDPSLLNIVSKNDQFVSDSISATVRKQLSPENFRLADPEASRAADLQLSEYPKTDAIAAEQQFTEAQTALQDAMAQIGDQTAVASEMANLDAITVEADTYARAAKAAAICQGGGKL